jgi:hypothetical protein
VGKDIVRGGSKIVGTLLIEIGMFLTGLGALIIGKAPISELFGGKLPILKDAELTEQRARIAGLLLMSALPLSIGAALILNHLVQSGALSRDVLRFAVLLDIAAIALPLLGVVALAVVTKPKGTNSS